MDKEDVNSSIPGSIIIGLFLATLWYLGVDLIFFLQKGHWSSAPLYDWYNNSHQFSPEWHGIKRILIWLFELPRSLVLFFVGIFVTFIASEN